MNKNQKIHEMLSEEIGEFISDNWSEIPYPKLVEIARELSLPLEEMLESYYDKLKRLKGEKVK